MSDVHKKEIQTCLEILMELFGRIQDLFRELPQYPWSCEEDWSRFDFDDTLILKTRREVRNCYRGVSFLEEYVKERLWQIRQRAERD